MRSQAVAGRRRWALSAARLGPQYLRDVLRASAGATRPVYLVPLAIFRNTGYRRKESRLATLVYSVQEAPGEARRLVTYLWAPEELQVSVGRHVHTAMALAPDGSVAGVSDVRVNDTDRAHAQIGITLVDPAHRGKRLGLALKLAILVPPLCLLVLIGLMAIEGDYTFVTRGTAFTQENVTSE